MSSVDWSPFLHDRLGVLGYLPGLRGSRPGTSDDFQRRRDDSKRIPDGRLEVPEGFGGLQPIVTSRQTVILSSQTVALGCWTAAWKSQTVVSRVPPIVLRLTSASEGLGRSSWNAQHPSPIPGEPPRCQRRSSGESGRSSRYTLGLSGGILRSSGGPRESCRKSRQSLGGQRMAPEGSWLFFLIRSNLARFPRHRDHGVSSIALSRLEGIRK